MWKEVGQGEGRRRVRGSGRRQEKEWNGRTRGARTEEGENRGGMEMITTSYDETSMMMNKRAFIRTEWRNTA